MGVASLVCKQRQPPPRWASLALRNTIKRGNMQNRQARCNTGGGLVTLMAVNILPSSAEKLAAVDKPWVTGLNYMVKTL